MKDKELTIIKSPL
ncbi:hypothetical protein pipiens_000492, partial [Culex pipiens pipiens]